MFGSNNFELQRNLKKIESCLLHFADMTKKLNPFNKLLKKYFAWPFTTIITIETGKFAGKFNQFLQDIVILVQDYANSKLFFFSKPN